MTREESTVFPTIERVIPDDVKWELIIRMNEMKLVDPVVGTEGAV